MSAFEWFLSQGRWAEVVVVAVLAVIGLLLVKVLVSVSARVVVLLACLAAMIGGLYLLQGLRERKAHVDFTIVAEARVTFIKGKGLKGKLKKGQRCRLITKGRYLRPNNIDRRNLHKAYLEAASCTVTLECAPTFTHKFKDEYAGCKFMLGRGFVRYRCDPCKGGPSIRIRPYKKRAYLRVDTTKPHTRATLRLKYVKRQPHKLD